MTRVRGFEVISKYKKDKIQLPKRSTEASAGYDIRANETVTIPVKTKDVKPILVHTGVKAYFPNNEALMVFNRSSNPVKRGLYLANSVGVIDADYYDNESNQGELMAEFINLSSHDYTIKKGDRIVQGVFMPYLLADNDNASGKRTGGVGSTGR